MDLGASDKRHTTALARAAKMGRLRCVCALIDEHGADVNVRADRSGYTALLVASYEGHTDVVRALLARGADPFLTNKWGETPLKAASKATDREAVVALLREAEARVAAAGVGGGGAAAAAKK